MDADGDLHAPILGCLNYDCRDDDPTVHDDATEVCDDEIDDDCDGDADCLDGDCADFPACMSVEPTEVSFLEHGGVYTIRLGFPGGEGSSYTFVPESELGMSVYGWGELVEIDLPDFPRDPVEWPVASIEVSFSFEGPPLASARVHATSSSSDPASRFTGTTYDDLSMPVPVRGDRYYWVQLYPESGPDPLEILRFRGML